MFREACIHNSGGVYGTLSFSKSGTETTWCNGTGFMISPGIIVMAAHCLHVENDIDNKRHKSFQVICTSDVNNRLENASLIEEDKTRDVALLKINNPRSIKCLSLEAYIVDKGTACGSLGFPLSSTEFLSTGIKFNIIERFQSAYISAYIHETLSDGGVLLTYETNNFMYAGSSGCPGFLVNGDVFGMLVGARANTFMEQVAISLWVPSIEIINFAQNSGIKIDQTYK